MKKMIVKLSVFLLGIALCLSVATAESGKDTEPRLLKDQDAVIEAIEQICPDDAFGGIYFDGETLVIHVVGVSAVRGMRAITDEISGEVDVTYRIVKHPLRDLERVKDFLTLHMGKYGISVLDANEVTNQVDVYLHTYTENVMEQIRRLVAEKYGEDIPLHFLDKSNAEIKYTAGHKEPPSEPLDPASDQNDATRMPALSGARIIINGGTYTLGPALSGKRAITAGHGYQGTAPFYLVGHPANIYLGMVTSYYGGIYGDWGNASAVDTVGPIVGRITPVVGRTVYMWGGFSGVTSGTITQTNVSVSASPPYAALTGMCAGSYPCTFGDSGAGIFSSSIANYSSSTSTYGVQSSAYFTLLGSWVGPSYFTPITKVS